MSIASLCATRPQHAATRPEPADHLANARHSLHDAKEAIADIRRANHFDGFFKGLGDVGVAGIPLAIIASPFLAVCEASDVVTRPVASAGHVADAGVEVVLEAKARTSAAFASVKRGLASLLD